MTMQSRLFRGDPKLQACAVSDPAHVTQGAQGDHVMKIQAAIIDIDGAEIDERELAAKLYGPSTAAAVLAYKQKRDIVNRSYQSTADNIVGKMTIASLDEELVNNQRTDPPAAFVVCRHSRPVRTR